MIGIKLLCCRQRYCVAFVSAGHLEDDQDQADGLPGWEWQLANSDLRRVVFAEGRFCLQDGQGVRDRSARTLAGLRENLVGTHRCQLHTPFIYGADSHNDRLRNSRMPDNLLLAWVRYAVTGRNKLIRGLTDKRGSRIAVTRSYLFIRAAISSRSSEFLSTAAPTSPGSHR